MDNEHEQNSNTENVNNVNNNEQAPPIGYNNQNIPLPNKNNIQRFILFFSLGALIMVTLIGIILMVKGLFIPTSSDTPVSDAYTMQICTVLSKTATGSDYVIKTNCDTFVTKDKNLMDSLQLDTAYELKVNTGNFITLRTIDSANKITDQ